MDYSLAQIEDFAQGVLWKHMVQLIEEWEHDILGELAAPTFNVKKGEMDFTADERAMYDESLRGALKACANFKSLPEALVESLTQKEQQNE